MKHTLQDHLDTFAACAMVQLTCVQGPNSISRPRRAFEHPSRHNYVLRRIFTPSRQKRFICPESREAEDRRGDVRGGWSVSPPPSVCYFGFDDPVNVLVQGHASPDGRGRRMPLGRLLRPDHDHHLTDIMIMEVSALKKVLKNTCPGLPLSLPAGLRNKRAINHGDRGGRIV